MHKMNYVYTLCVISPGKQFCNISTWCVNVVRALWSYERLSLKFIKDGDYHIKIFFISHRITKINNNNFNENGKNSLFYPHLCFIILYRKRRLNLFSYILILIECLNHIVSGKCFKLLKEYANCRNSKLLCFNRSGGSKTCILTKLQWY